MIIIKYGGSILNPDGNYDQRAIDLLVKLIKKQADKQFCFIIGGGKICRHVQSASKSLLHPILPEPQLSPAMDEIGIAMTKINARYVQTILREELGEEKVCPHLVIDPSKPPIPGYQVYLATGTVPGHSTDHVMMSLAKTLEAKSAIKISDFPVVLNVKPHEFIKEHMGTYEKLPQMRWQQLRDLVGEWVDGGNYPLDPDATSIGVELAGTGFFLLIGQYAQLEKMVAEEPFVGTRVEG
jgi:uridylate kinase